MGPANARIQAQDCMPVQLVELDYAYRPLVSNVCFASPDIVESVAVPVRADRDLHQVSNDEKVTASRCA